MTLPATVSNPFTDAAFEAFLAERQEPKWVQRRRRRAWQHFSEMPWPARTEEEWIRTDIRLFHPEKYHLPAPRPEPESVSTPQGEMALADLAGQVTSVDSEPVRAELAASLAKQGVIFESLSTVVNHSPPWLEALLMQRAFDETYDRFAAWHAACWSGGALLYVPAGVKVEQPFHLLSTLRDGGADFGHVFVLLEEDAEATLVCETSSLGAGDGLHCGGVELVVGPRSKLRFVTYQNWNRRTWHFAHQKACIAKDAELEWTVGALGSRLAKVNQTVALEGQGASCLVNGTMFTEGRQHMAYHTLQHHIAPQCQSDFLYKTALQDESRTVWRGMIRVEPKAQLTDGYQRCDNLMLSKDARADSIPGLEIEADDVRCTHGSTTGSVDEEILFYAMSRGFTRREASRMMVTGFFQQVFDRSTVASVRDALEAAVAQRVREYA